jgi:hypothetical protein
MTLDAIPDDRQLALAPLDRTAVVIAWLGAVGGQK